MNSDGLSQRRSAIISANERRSAMANIKRELAAYPHAESLAALASYLTDGDPVVARMKLGDILRACRGVHNQRTRAILRQIHAGESYRVEELSPRQRNMLIDILRRAS